MSPPAPTSTAFVALVPWSIARMSGSGAGIAQDLADGGGDAVGVEPEVVEKEAGAAGRGEAADAEDPHRHRAAFDDHARHGGPEPTAHRRLLGRDDRARLGGGSDHRFLVERVD